MTQPQHQPTNQTLSASLRKAIHLEGTGELFDSAFDELSRLRELRTTWFGSEENNLRRSLDKYLREYLCPSS